MTIHVRPFAPADQPRLKALADATMATCVRPRDCAIWAAKRADVHLLLAEANAEIIGALTALGSPGGMALVLSPLSIHPGAPAPDVVADALLKGAAAALRADATKLAYALLPPDAPAEAEPLLRNGYRRITELVYCQAFVAETPPKVQLGEVELIPFEAQPRAFAAALLRSYEGTLDCPELDGLRTIEEVLIGHAAVGAHGTALWRLVMRGGAPVGVVLRAEIEEEDTLELVYLGLAPEVRGQGLGRRLMRRVLADARAEGLARVTLSVDCRNGPALRLYESLGFQPYDRRQLYLADLNSRADPRQET